MTRLAAILALCAAPVAADTIRDVPEIMKDMKGKGDE